MNPSGDGSDNWHRPVSLEDWKQRASTKLDVLAEIVAHHLQTDNPPPLRVSEDRQTLTHDKFEVTDPLSNHNCDCIIVFSLFPSSNAGILDVSFPFHLVLLLTPYLRY